MEEDMCMVKPKCISHDPRQEPLSHFLSWLQVKQRMKQFKEVQMEQENYWKSKVEDLKLERDMFKNDLQSKENEWKAEKAEEIL
ncbi:hypothetical protein TNCV_1392471 [Trichonephila clavipes]|nr:hypothetical protein TNCV_1392471 [Trichonephila clavipes]